LVIGAVLLLIGLLMFWGRTTLFDADGFTDRATVALDNEAVRGLLAGKLADQIIAHGPNELITVRPLVQATVSQAMLTGPFQVLYRNAVREAHRSLMGGDESIALRLVDVMILVTGPLESLDPRLAAKLPEIRTSLIELRRRDFASDLIAGASQVRFLGWLIPLLSLVLFGIAVRTASDRDRAIAGVGFAFAAVGTIVLAGLVVGRAILTESLADPVESEAVAGLWKVFVRDLRLFSFVFIAIGIALSAAVNSVVRHVDTREYSERLGWIVRRTPKTALGRLARALAIVVAAVATVAWPALVAKGLIVVVAICAIYYGLIELFMALGIGAHPSKMSGIADDRKGFLTALGRRAVVYTVFIVVFLIICVLATSLIMHKPAGRFVGIDSEIEACNGSRDLCDSPLNEVAFPTTHNSMSAASEDGWFFASHEGGIGDQLEYGVRGFLIDVYFGIPVEGGIRTDIFHAGDRAALAEEFGEGFVEARDRIAERLGLADPSIERQAYLCHGFCELGATPLSDALKLIKEFLDTHPQEVIVIFVEDHIPADDVASVFEQVGLSDYAYTHQPGDSWPTLREMIKSNKRMLVMAENDGSGPAWYHPGFVLAQETPYRFRSPDRFSCEPNRGTPESPLFQMNHWIERLTPSIDDAEAVNQYDVLFNRAVSCQNKRGMIPNLVAVNFYSRGDLLRVVDTLNGVSDAAEVIQSPEGN